MKEAAQIPGAFQKAFWLMREGRPGPVLLDLPIDMQLTEIEFDIDTYEPLPVQRPAATPAQASKIIDMLTAAERPVIVAGGGIINADAADLTGGAGRAAGGAGDPHPDGLGRHPR